MFPLSCSKLVKSNKHNISVNHTIIKLAMY